MRSHARHLLTIIAGLLAGWSSAQMIYSKDGLPICDRMEFMTACVSAAEKEMLRFNDMEVRAYGYCSCLCDAVLPQLSPVDLMRINIDINVLKELLMKEPFLSKFTGCILDNATINEDARIASMIDNDTNRRTFMAVCRANLQTELTAGTFTEQAVDEYCTCALERMIAADLDYGELLRVDRTDERAYNEVIMPCIKALTGTAQPLASARENGDVYGCTGSVVPLVDLLGRGYNVRLSIGDVVRYFLLDTGASDLIIGSDLAEELRRKGLLTYISDGGGTTIYKLANGREVPARKVLLHEVVIGECRVEDVVAAVVKDGSLLCGRSFLDRFSHWEISGSSEELLLQR